MRTQLNLSFIVSVVVSLALITGILALAVHYAKSVTLNKGSQAGFDNIPQKDP